MITDSCTNKNTNKCVWKSFNNKCTKTANSCSEIHIYKNKYGHKLYKRIRTYRIFN